MFFDINPSNGVPVYEQVSRQVKFAIANGAYEAGQMIPSVREMARNLTINPNTVARAYRQLQDEQVIETIRGSGLAVSTGAKTVCKNERSKLVRQRIIAVLQEAIQSQLGVEDIRQIIDQELERLAAKRSTQRNTS
jgi:GntR family transcriptional regulator